MRATMSVSCLSADEDRTEIVDRVHDRLDPREANVAQHGLNTKRVWAPPIGFVVRQFLLGVEDHPGTVQFHRVHVSFHDQRVGGKLGDVLHHLERVAQMIEDTGEQHHVKRNCSRGWQKSVARRSIG